MIFMISTKCGAKVIKIFHMCKHARVFLYFFVIKARAYGGLALAVRPLCADNSPLASGIPASYYIMPRKMPPRPLRAQYGCSPCGM